MKHDPTPPSPSELDRKSRKARTQGTELLTMGLSVGAIGLAGAALGAVCPLCVVATPTLLGAGLVQKLRGALLSRQADAALTPADAGRNTP